MSEAIEPPRGLVIAAGCWIIASFLVAFGLRLPLHLSPSTLAPTVQLILLTTASGMMTAWPLLRLSQPPRDRTIARPVIDALTLACLWQLLVWPLRLATPWPTERTLLIDLLALASLAGVAGLVAAASAWRSSILRALAMAACILVAVGISMPLAALGFQPSPFSAVFMGGIPTLLTVMNSEGSLPNEIDWENLVVISVVSGALCVVGLLFAAAASNRPPTRSNQVASGRRVG